MKVTSHRGSRGFGRTLQARYQIVALEDVTVPAGTFKAYRIEASYFYDGYSWQYRIADTYWVQPGWGDEIRHVYEVRYARGALERQVTEMISRTRGDG